MKYQIHVRNVKIALGALRQHIMSVIIIITIKKELCNSIYQFFRSFVFFEYVFCLLLADSVLHHSAKIHICWT